MAPSSSRLGTLAGAALLLTLGAAQAASACDGRVDFETQPLGMSWGAAFGTPPGVDQWSQDGVKVAYLPDAAGSFNEARIVPPIAGFGVGQIESLNNIATRFDFSDIGCVEQVTFEFADLGGIENLQVNGAPVYVGDIVAAPLNIAPGVTCTVSAAPIPGGIAGTVKLTGPISRVVVAGQEFWIDDVCYFACDDPPPPSDCDHLMDFESQPIGAQWGGPLGTPIGVPQFFEDGIGARFFPIHFGAFNIAQIDASFLGFGSGNILQLNNIAYGADVGVLGCVERVTFDYMDLGGVENLQVNGGPLYVGDLPAAPAMIAPGVFCTVTAAPLPGGVGITGQVILEGRIETFRVAGQEFWIDNVCVELSDCVGDLDCDGVVGFSDLVALLASWGPCGGLPCDADFDMNGSVDFADLVTLLAAWGDC